MSNNTKRKESEVEPSRRSFLTKLLIGLGFIALVEFVWVLISFLRPRRHKASETNSEAIITAGPVDSFTPGSVTAFVRGRFYLSRLEEGGFLALSRKCTHLGCTVPWIEKDKKFECPCHASAFDITGDVINPPAPRALDIYQVFIENNIVKVNTGKLIKRSEFRPEQVAYPEK